MSGAKHLTESYVTNAFLREENVHMGIDYDFFLAPYGNSHVCKKKKITYFFFNKMIRFCFSSRQDHTIGEALEYHNTDKNN